MFEQNILKADQKLSTELKNQKNITRGILNACKRCHFFASVHP